MSRILVVYYSRTGRTRQIAEAIATQLNAETESIQDIGQRSGIRGYIRSLLEAVQNHAIRIAPPAKDPSEYDLIILGTPVWAHKMCSPVRAYVTAQQKRFKKIAVFCTQGGSGGDKVVGQVGDLCGHSPAATLVLNDDDIGNNRFTAKLDVFVQSLAQAKAA